MFDLRIGTVLRANEALAMIPKLMPFGFESYEITFGDSTAAFQLKEMGKETLDKLGDSGIVISSLGVYGNPLLDAPKHAETLASLERVIDNARYFNCSMVSAFTGRIPGCSADQSIPRFAEVFSKLAKRAADQGVRIAFENCPMRGNWNNGEWNIAFNAELWEMMFNAAPMENLGLEWEPAHQMLALVDPIPQLRKWAGKVFHVHGKDATIAWDILREKGLNGSARFAWDRTPGFGDINWNDIVTILRMNKYQGTIDIEGYHDMVYSTKELEWPSQVRSLKYLKECRGGADWFDLSDRA